MINLSKLFEVNYLFEPLPNHQFAFYRPLFGLGFLVLALVLLAYFLGWPKISRLGRKIGLVFSFGLFLLLAFRFISVNYLSARILLVLWLGAGILSLAFELKAGFSGRVSPRRFLGENQDRYAKYLPESIKKGKG